jgi:hypothetical protein
LFDHTAVTICKSGYSNKKGCKVLNVVGVVWTKFLVKYSSWKREVAPSKRYVPCTNVDTLTHVHIQGSSTTKYTRIEQVAKVRG